MHIYTYKIPFFSPFAAAKIREGIIIETKNGWGEAAPLPSFSHENFFDVLTSIHQGSKIEPSVYFAYQCAAVPLPTAFPKIPLCALASNMLDAETAIKNGFKTIKIKVKNLSISEAIHWTSTLQKNLDIRLRIDVNQQWTLTEAKRFFCSIEPTRIDYIEEPLNNPSELFHLSSLPIALDETLRNDSIEFIQNLPNLAAFVLKPTLLGRRLKHRISLGLKLKKNIVFSSCFESAIGLLHIAHLQAKTNPNTAVGIDTYRSFQNNFFPIPTKNGMLSDETLPPIDRTWLIDSVL